MLFLTAVWLF